MAENNQEARFPINLEGNASEVAEEMAGSLEDLRKKITGNLDALKDMSGSLRRLRGSSAKDAISTATLAIGKQGTSYEKLTAQTKAAALEQQKLQDKLKSEKEKTAADNTKRLENAVRAAGGPVESLSNRIKSMKDVLGGANMAEAALALGTVALVAAIAAVSVAAIAAGIAFTRFVVESANAARSAGLLREAVLGSAEQSANLGTQVDALARKIAMPKNEINALSAEISRFSRLTGPEIVDTMNAVGQASSAMGAGVGKTIQDIITRGQRFQRLQINPFELQGTGVEFSDVAAQLAKNTGRSVKDAQQALYLGRVKLDVGAKAIRDVIEARFGEVNGKKLLDLGTQFEKLKENAASLVSGVKLEGFLKSLKSLFDLLDPSKTVTGSVLKQVATIIGNDLVGSMTKGGPIAKSFFKGMVIGALELMLALGKTRNALRSTFRNNPALQSLFSLKDAALLGKLAMYGLGAALVTAGAAAAGLAVSLSAILESLGKIADSVKGLSIASKNHDAKGVGLNLANGVSAGIDLGKGPVQLAMEKLGAVGITALANKMEVHSPSKATERLGRYLPQGAAIGIEAETPRVDRAMRDMIDLPPPPAPRGGGMRGIGNTTVTIPVSIDARGASEGGIAMLNDASFLAKLTDAIELALAGAGITVQPFGTTPSLLPVGTP